MARLRAVRVEQFAPWLVGIVAFGTAVWAAQPYPVGVFHDDGVYITLAKSLATGEGYRYLNQPGTPVATHYPPAYPLLLAALWKLAPNFPRNIPILQLANAIALGLAAWAAMTFARRTLGWTQPAAIVGVVVGTLSYPLLGLSVYLLSAPLFAALLLPSLIFAERVAAAANTGLVMATVLGLGGARAETRAYQEQSWHQPGQRAARGAGPLILWVESKTRPEDVIAVESEQLVYLFTGRRALPPQAFTAAEYVRPTSIKSTTESLRRMLSEFPVTYIVTGDPQVLRAARVLSDSAASPGLRARLVPIDGPRNGGAFRVERRDSSTINP